MHQIGDSGAVGIAGVPDPRATLSIGGGTPAKGRCVFCSVFSADLRVIEGSCAWLVVLFCVCGRRRSVASLARQPSVMALAACLGDCSSLRALYRAARAVNLSSSNCDIVVAGNTLSAGCGLCTVTLLGGVTEDCVLLVPISCLRFKPVGSALASFAEI